jgi:thiol-disulfide isomerase/thioredoxin
MARTMLPRLLVLILTAIVLAGCEHPPANTPRRAEHGLAAGEIGSHLPDFSVQDLEGRTISSADLRAKVVLVDFWATWCGPCKKEMPGYQQLEDRYGAQGFVIIGFKFDTMADDQDPMQFAKRIGVRYPLAVATEDVKRGFGGIEGLPTTLLYDRQGVLRKKVVGFEYTDVFDAAIKPLL